MSQQIRPVVNVFYFVADLQAGIAWYRALLGTDLVDVRPQLAMFQVGTVRLTGRGPVMDRGVRPRYSTQARFTHG